MKCLVLMSLILLSGSLFGGTRTIFSMNLHCALGDWKGRTDIVLNEIIKRDPDIIGLQEVCHNSEVDMTKYIVQKLKDSGYPLTFFRTAETHRTFLKYREQLLIITKLPVKNSFESWLPSMKLFENKFLAIDVGDMWAVTTHLHFLLPQIREKQFDVLNKKFSDKKTIIFGDLNSNPDDSETEVFNANNWTSYYGDPTYPSSQPTKTFDGFWATFSREYDFEILFKDHQPAPSDHLGIWLKLK